MNPRQVTFEVNNTGDNPTRDFHTTLLLQDSLSIAGHRVPKEFTSEGKRTVGSISYTVYKNFKDMPVYADSSLKIGELLLFATEGQHSILWEIDSADGKFPLGGQLGKIVLSLESDV